MTLAGYVYDTFANLHTVNYADGFSIVYAPNAIGQPTQAGPYASNISYHRNGALKQFTYGNGIVHTMSQNARQLPARSTDSGGVLDLGYVYDGNANVASITDYTTGGNQSRTLSYDTLDRLTQAVGPSFGTATYAYNVLDDITRLTVTGGNKPRDHVYNYGAGTHRLDSVTDFVGGATVIGLSYDPQGNLSNKNGQGFDFDYGNRLRNVPGKETYRYDGHGRRVYSFTTTHAVWQYSNDGQLMYSHDNRNNRKTNYVYLQGSLLATREAPMSGGDGTYTVKYQHTDALGSPVKVTDAAGLTVETSEYEPYGHLANRALTDGPGFTGHVQDASTGLTYMQQRYYDPGIGRFLSVDPVTADGNTGGNFNRYWYANNNPYKFTDPDGRLANFIIGAGIGAGIEIVSQIATKGKVDNWTAVEVSAGVGALTGGVASIAGKAAVSGAISARTAVAATAATGGLASGTGKVVEGAITGKPASAKEVAVAGVAGLAGSGAGAKIGLNAVAKLETMAASNGIAGHVGRTTQAAVQQGGKITEASTSATQKAAQVTADTASSYVEKKINK